MDMIFNGLAIYRGNPRVLLQMIPVLNKSKLQQIRKYDKDKILQRNSSWRCISATIYNDKDHATYCCKDLLPKTKIVALKIRVVSMM